MTISATTVGACIFIKLDTGIEMEIGPGDTLVIWDKHDRFTAALTHKPADEQGGHLTLNGYRADRIYSELKSP